MIGRIASKELKEMYRDGRFRWMATVVMGLLIGALAMGSRHYRAVESQHELARNETRERWVGQGE